MERGSSNALQAANQQLHEAEQLRQQRKLTRAQAICEALVNRHPDYVAALCTLGLICGDKGNYPQALVYLGRTAMHDPFSWPTLLALGDIYLQLGATEMAVQTLQQARLVNPQNPHISSRCSARLTPARANSSLRGTPCVRR
jgi:Flp pilus assembly protein TadD